MKKNAKSKEQEAIDEEKQKTMRHKDWDHALGWSISYLQAAVDSWETPGTDDDLSEAVSDSIGAWPFELSEEIDCLWSYATDEASSYVRAKARLEGRLL